MYYGCCANPNINIIWVDCYSMCRFHDSHKSIFPNSDSLETLLLRLVVAVQSAQVSLPRFHVLSLCCASVRHAQQASTVSLYDCRCQQEQTTLSQAMAEPRRIPLHAYPL